MIGKLENVRNNVLDEWMLLAY